jgi:hypothetical protein
MKLNTVNVVECYADSLQALHSFSNDDEGQQEAEQLFKQLASENGFTKDEIKNGLEQGTMYNADNPDYQLFIVHGV